MCFCKPTIRTPFCPDCNTAMFLRINELTAERDALKADAERYRWLRSKVKYAVPMVRVMIMDRGTYYLRETPAELDEAIDAAMKETK